MNDCAIVLPNEDDKWLFFRDYGRKERLPLTIYADMECALEKKSSDDEDDDDNDDERFNIINATNNSFAYQHHKAFSIGYYLCSTLDEIASVYRFRRGDDCIPWFVEELGNIAERAYTLLTENGKPMQLTLAEETAFLDADARCHVCNRTFVSTDTRVRDHCHLTGRYRGPAHSHCNLNYRKSYVIPVFFHNLSGYDAHFIIEKIANAYEGSVDLLPITKEKYISFTKNVNLRNRNGGYRMKLRFVDSFRFLATSLDNLASYLRADQLRIVRSEFAHLNADDFALLTRKGVFPYEHVDDVTRLAETELPPRDAFYSSLTSETVSEADYEHARTVWRRFGIRDLGEYSDLYLRTDVLLLADIFETFRDVCIDSYGLDPAHYFTLPGYTWDAMLKHTDIRLELLTDIDMVLFVERGIRGGLSQCSNRYARADNRYINPENRSGGAGMSSNESYLMYYDVNNLYGWAMSEALPYGDFRWLNETEIALLDLTSLSPNSEIGYILEVDIAYPPQLHDAHADLPFCPTHEQPPGKRNVKLLATLYDKSRYVLHYRCLQQCTAHGLRVTRYHRVLQFAQSSWLRSYIELNTTFRIRAPNTFESNLYKLMNNAVFGKTMENVREHVDVRLVTRWDGRYGAEALISKPNFHSRSVFSENLMAVELRRLRVLLAKPIYVGMSILEISKTRLYEFHYDYMLPLYRSNATDESSRCRLMYTDTDSLIYHIVTTTRNPYENMRRDLTRFDTSDYPIDNAYDMPRANKRVPGLMKDEICGEIMTEFVGLRAKMYAYKINGREDTKRIKGVQRHVVTRQITFDDYKRCLHDLTEQTARQSCIRSRLHEVWTISECKLALSPYDDKRYVIPDSANGATLPWGHYAIIPE